MWSCLINTKIVIGQKSTSHVHTTILVLPCLRFASFYHYIGQKSTENYLSKLIKYPYTAMS